ncbi:MAG: hypothetical protein R3D67_09090 [Hyphomicrobiaceae bacterium]
MERRLVSAPAFKITSAIKGGLIEGRDQSCYNVQLLNEATGRPFVFDNERYVLVDKDQQARASYSALLDGVVNALPAGADYWLYLEAGGSSKRFSRARNVAASRRGLKEVTFYPLRRSGGGFAAKPTTSSVPQKYEPKHLPLLRADNLREILSKAGDVSRLEILEGRLLNESDAAAHTFALYLCVAWPS